ncbi:hypothetical protein M3M33_16700, partial [Loigolactobacillus coryniformis]|uniref:hypothetical protein n=1 Tax=Loigolactobacillus coryniformis TaxID=1610 RepID=UPI00201ABC34
MDWKAKGALTPIDVNEIENDSLIGALENPRENSLRVKIGSRGHLSAAKIDKGKYLGRFANVQRFFNEVYA